MDKTSYIGSELSLFRTAVHWKAYWASRIEPFIRGDVLEVGAGIGANTETLATLSFNSWSSLEPDAELARSIPKISPRHNVITGTLHDVPYQDRYDTILYIDVLEHIDNDHDEVLSAARRLKPGGALVVLGPAHQWLYSEFDAAIGHFRRYSLEALRSLKPDGAREAVADYLDAVGLIASIGNRFLLRSGMPTEAQIRLWDSVMVPCSKALDRLTFGRVGKSVLVVWIKD